MVSPGQFVFYRCLKELRMTILTGCNLWTLISISFLHVQKQHLILRILIQSHSDIWFSGRFDKNKKVFRRINSCSMRCLKERGTTILTECTSWTLISISILHVQKQHEILRILIQSHSDIWFSDRCDKNKKVFRRVNSCSIAVWKSVGWLSLLGVLYKRSSASQFCMCKSRMKFWEISFSHIQISGFQIDLTKIKKCFAEWIRVL